MKISTMDFLDFKFESTIISEQNKTLVLNFDGVEGIPLFYIYKDNIVDCVSKDFFEILEEYDSGLKIEDFKFFKTSSIISFKGNLTIGFEIKMIAGNFRVIFTITEDDFVVYVNSDFKLAMKEFIGIAK